MKIGTNIPAGTASSKKKLLKKSDYYKKYGKQIKTYFQNSYLDFRKPTL